MIPAASITAWGVDRPWPSRLAVAKLGSQAFRRDLDLLVTRWPDGYDIDGAAELIIGQLVSQV